LIDERRRLGDRTGVDGVGYGYQPEAFAGLFAKEQRFRRRWQSAEVRLVSLFALVPPGLPNQEASLEIGPAMTGARTARMKMEIGRSGQHADHDYEEK
jgi:hypothetical protein